MEKTYQSIAQPSAIRFGFDDRAFESRGVGPLQRRALAWIIDLLSVCIPAAALALSQAERFAMAELNSNGLARIAQLEQSVTLRAEFGGSLYIWAPTSITLTAVSAALLCFVLLALLPANVSGWTPGLRLAGLRVITRDGHRARLHHHLVRTTVGIVDLFPFVLPGLLGWVVAARDDDNRRLGDRAAGTMVVDRHHPERPLDPDRPRSRLTRATRSLGSSATRSSLPIDLAEAERRWAIVETEVALNPSTAQIVAGDAARSAEISAVLPPVSRSQRSSTPELSNAAPKQTASGPTRPDQADATSSSDIAGDEIGEVRWDDDLTAWVYYDERTRCRFRHDVEQGCWVKVG